MTPYILIYVTCADNQEAQHIAMALLAENLVACANILPPIRSLYHWQGQAQESAETPVLLKTRSDKFAAIESRIMALHSYDTPCILALPIVDGQRAFLQWIGDSINPDKP